MVGRGFLALVVCLAQTGALRADAPRVMADIAPVHGLVAQVMRDVGTPGLILRPGASPHDYALRPSEAAALQEADLIVWTGPALTPWLDSALGALSAEAGVLQLIGVPGTYLLDYRDDVGGHDHEGHTHDHAAHGDDPQHAGVDPHAWLDPDNARLWLDAIADDLSARDPDNAATYRRNAEAGKTAIDAAEAEARRMLEPFGDAGYLVFHDAWQYFEGAFGLHPAGAISLGDAASPGPARIAALRARVGRGDIDCVFSEPQFSDAMIATVFEGVEVGHAVLDPLGSSIAPGPDFYPAFLRGIAGGMAECLR